jgi:hypothetical protein
MGKRKIPWDRFFPRDGIKLIYLVKAAIPFRERVFKAAAVTLRVTQRFSSGIKILFFFMFGTQRRRVWRFEWDTLFPIRGSAPVRSQRLDIGGFSRFYDLKN